MAVPILQILVGLIVALSGLAMAGKAPTTKKEQWTYRGIFLFLGVVLLALAWMQFLSLSHFQTLAMQNMAVSTTPQRPLISSQPAETVSAAPEQIPAQTAASVAAPPPAAAFQLQEKYATLLRNLSKDPSLPPDARERIIIATAKLGQEAQALKQPSPEVLLAAESAKAKILPIFDYAIKSLAAMSDKVAAQKGDKSMLDYQGLPEELHPEGRDGQRARKSAAEIRFQSNPGWDFQVYFAEKVMPHYQASLSLTGKGGMLVLKSASDGIETHVEVLSGETSEHKPATGDEAKANIDDSLKKLVASETEAMDVGR
jgi:hypothetical protein